MLRPSTVMLVWVRMMQRASILDKLNRKREPEKLEAISHLEGMLKAVDARPSSQDRKIRDSILRILSSACQSFLQEPVVQSAARSATKSALLQEQTFPQ